MTPRALVALMRTIRPALRVLLLALALLPLAPLAHAAEGAPFPAPLAGEGALYRVVTHVAGRADATSQVYLAWDAEATLVPGAGERTLPALSATVLDDAARGAKPVVAAQDVGLANPGKDYAAQEPRLMRQRAAYVTAPGGTLLAREAEWFEASREDAATRGQWVHRVLRAEPCELDGVETLLAALAGHDAASGVALAQRCGADAAWREGAFVARFPDANVTLQPARGLAMPAAWTFETRGIRQEATLIGWRAGERALPTADPLPPAPRAPLVAWSAAGPARGDLPDHPFAEAQRAIAAQTREGAAFFGAHPEARILYATHAWSGAAALAAADSDRIKGVACTAAPLDPAGGGATWTASWVGDGASLFGAAHRASLLPGAPALERAATPTLDDYGIAQSGVPSSRAPAPADLLAHLHDLDAWIPRGDYSLDYAFVPTAHGNLEGAAAVSRGTCERDPATGAMAYVGESLWFIDGEARALVGTTIERATPTPAGALLATLSPPPASGRASLVPAGLAPAAGLLLVGGAAAVALGFAPRALQALYHRIGRGSALDSEQRARMLELVHRHPGVALRDLAAQMGLSPSSAEHHARVLARLGYVRRVRTSAGAAFYASEHPRAPYAHVLDRAHADEALALLAARPGLTQNELAQALGVRKTHLSSLLRALESEGLVSRERDGRAVRVVATQKALSLRS